MRDEDILESLKKHDQDHQVFVLRSESFISRWAPNNPYERHRFTADLMGLFRELIMTRHQIHCEVSTQYFKQSMDLAMRQPMPSVIIETKKGTTDEG